MMETASHETVVALIEVVVVIIQIAHGYHTLAVVFVNLTIDAIALDAADMSIIDLSHLVGHKLHHLVFDGVALRILGHLLHIAAMLAKFLIVVFVGRATSVLVFGEKTMDHRVGIAADG